MNASDLSILNNNIINAVLLVQQSSWIRKPTMRINLATWICYIFTLLQIINSFKQFQAVTLNWQYNYEIYPATVDNLINNSHPFAYAIGFSKKEVFYLGDMLKQGNKRQFFEAMNKEVAGYD